MSVSDIRSLKSILDAVQEYDALGQDAFLEKYGFGPAKSCFLTC